MSTDFKEIQHSALELDENHRAEFLDETEESYYLKAGHSIPEFFGRFSNCF